MKVALLSREYPPEVYGGAGVHVEYLARELRRLLDQVTVHCFGNPRSEPGVYAHSADPRLVDAKANAALLTLSTDLAMAAMLGAADIVHSHTWYANFGGHLSKLLYGIPHVVTTHSLEPLRPWKAEQLGGGYALSLFAEKTALEAADAIIAVSQGMAQDVARCYPAVQPNRIHVVHNGIDPEEYRPTPDDGLLARYGIDPTRPIVLFVGRITRQKGLPYLLRAAQDVRPAAQLVLLASAADTPEIAAEVEAGIARLQEARSGVVWIRRMVPKSELIRLLTAASVFVCPSIYEPMGIVNLEAMACETAVVATRTGGIPEVVVDGETGVLVPIDPDPTDPYGAPRDAGAFASALAAAINTLLDNPEQAVELGRNGRRRAIEKFSWTAIANRTVEIYRSVLG
ncbi:glycogen synthase (ADP-glucose) [Acidothermus cellulolyticus 11B]|uniref:Glycogen synthase (ADP-glucose) n=1 Tax=Acidothermus cellulolyticus (strain ATCC 43068 / DSM 8971 / 11B) TaxID=351607 RepID=A0LVY4_ACIC1|nr:glycogen synthase [Acidothermus cellulolyticus]ABK53594.1 glycogen synthase (ADP-glucose) [Acidothermus cellulolyticus 11B]